MKCAGKQWDIICLGLLLRLRPLLPIVILLGRILGLILWIELLLRPLIIILKTVIYIWASKRKVIIRLLVIIWSLLVVASILRHLHIRPVIRHHSSIIEWIISRPCLLGHTRTGCYKSNHDCYYNPKPYWYYSWYIIFHNL